MSIIDRFIGKDKARKDFEEKNLIYRPPEERHRGNTSPNEGRDKYILQAYKSGKTLDEIGKRIGVTRERIRQIVSRSVHGQELEEIKKKSAAIRHKAMLENRKHKCEMCTNIIATKNTRFCSRECLGAARKQRRINKLKELGLEPDPRTLIDKPVKKLTKEEYRVYNAGRTSDYYKRHPGYVTKMNAIRYHRSPGDPIIYGLRCEQKKAGLPLTPFPSQDPHSKKLVEEIAKETGGDYRQLMRVWTFMVVTKSWKQSKLKTIYRLLHGTQPVENPYTYVYDLLKPTRAAKHVKWSLPTKEVQEVILDELNREEPVLGMLFEKWFELRSKDLST